MMKKISCNYIIGLTIILSSCDYGRNVSVEFVNNSSLPVVVCYPEKRMPYEHELITNDTVCHELTIGTSLRKEFFVWWGGKKSLSKEISFIKFKTPDKSISFEGPDEVLRVFSKRKELKNKYCYEFLITDSLFSEEQH